MKRKQARFWFLLLFIMISILSMGCPIPVPQNTIMQPKMQFQTLDPQGKPIEGQKVEVTLGSHPHGKYHYTHFFKSDQNGLVSIKELKKTKWVMPLMMHGVPQYFWVICAHNPKYKTYRKRFYINRKTTFKEKITFKEGKSEKICPDPKSKQIHRRSRRYRKATTKPTSQKLK